MSTRKSFFFILLSLFLLSFGYSAMAQEAGDPIIRMDSSSKTELDLSIMVQDMLPRLINIIAEEDPENAEMIQNMLDLIGIDALMNLKTETKESRDHSEAEMTLTLDPQKKDTLVYRLLTTPNGECNFAKNVSRDETVMFMTIHNFPHYLDVIFDFLASPEMVEMMEGELPLNENGDLDLGGFVPRRDLLPLLSGEFDFFVLDSPEGAEANPMTMPFYLVLGAHDGFALRDKILEIASIMTGEAGEGITSMLDSIEPEMIGDFEMKVTPFGAAFAVSQDYLVIGMDPDSMREVLEGNKGDLKVPNGIEWAFINGPKYGDFLESALGMAAMMSPDDAGEMEWMMEMYGVLFDHLEYEEILYRSRTNGLEMEFVVDGPVLTGVYKMLPTLLDKLPEIMAMEKEKEYENEYRGAIAIIDDAMMAFASDHNGFYPEDPRELHQYGYMNDWPFMTETSIGDYFDWGYNYHPYYSEDAEVVGYIFVLFGGGEGTGYDLYTEENMATEGPFNIDRDGMPDGVASYCYDGVALDLVQEYLEK